MTGFAGGDPLENFKNRSYKGKSVKVINITDLAMVTDAYSKMKGKPVIVSIRTRKAIPMISGLDSTGTEPFRTNAGLRIKNKGAHLSPISIDSE
jgi:hypothetical protein